MAAHVRLKNDFTEAEKYHNLMSWLIFLSTLSISGCQIISSNFSGMKTDAFINIYFTAKTVKVTKSFVCITNMKSLP